MLIDARHVPAAATLRAEVAVIGAGPAGITVARELAGHGVNVLLIEAAGRHHIAADDHDLAGASSGAPFPLVRSRHRGFGGTSTHWTEETGLRVRPLDDIDFAARAGRPNGAWPFGAEQLHSYYERAYRLIALDPANTPARWFGDAAPTPLAWDGGPELAMFQFAGNRCFVDQFDEVVADSRIDLVLNGCVAEIQPDEAGPSVRALAIATRDGNRFNVIASAFVLACGGIDNARLLLASPGHSGAGVGNEHDNVGRWFMDHLSVDTGIIEPMTGTRVSADIFRHQRSQHGRFQPMLWLGSERIAGAELPNAAFWVEEIDPRYLSRGVSAARNLRAGLHSSPRRHIARHAFGVLRGATDLGGYAVRRVLRPSPRRVLAMRIMTEQIPDRESRVRLSSQRDAFGLPRVDLHWRISDSDLDMITAHQSELGRLLEERGVARLTRRFDRRTCAEPIMSNFHHLGTTRMHVDPRHGVVDAECRVHTSPNLYVAGGSVFPTGGYLNPTLTILALAVRLADTIRRDRGPAIVTPPPGMYPPGSFSPRAATDGL